MNEKELKAVYKFWSKMILKGCPRRMGIKDYLLDMIHKQSSQLTELTKYKRVLEKYIIDVVKEDEKFTNIIFKGVEKNQKYCKTCRFISEFETHCILFEKELESEAQEGLIRCPECLKKEREL